MLRDAIAAHSDDKQGNTNPSLCFLRRNNCIEAVLAEDPLYAPQRSNLSFPTGDAPSASLWMLRDRDRFAHSG
jgi:hypothetical protein